MSYAHAFSAIRQLAVSLRGALNMKTKDGYKEVGFVSRARTKVKCALSRC